MCQTGFLTKGIGIPKTNFTKLGFVCLQKDLVETCTARKRAFGSSENLFVKSSSGETPLVALGHSFF